MNTYYDLLGVSTNSDTNAIIEGYNNRIALLYQDLVNNEISTEDYNKLYEICTAAKNVLINPAMRAEYDKKIGLGMDDSSLELALQNTGAHVANGGQGPQNNDHDDDDYEYDDDDDKAPKKRGWLKVALISGALVAAIAVAAWATPKVVDSLQLKSQGQNTVGFVDTNSPSPTESNTGTDSSGKDDDKPADEKEPEQNVVQINNYGDISDASLVSERAAKLLEEINKAGMINLTTSIPYTQEEIETLIYYVNGEYVPATEEEASTLYTEFLNFICAPINIDDTLIQSAYLGGEDSFKSTVEGFVQNQKRPDVVTAFTYGDSYVAPYLYWLQSKYYDMRYTTDRDEATRIFNEVFQSYADIMKGDGFTLDGVTYKETNILGLDKIAVSNMYIYFGLNAEVFRTTATKDYFEVTNHLLSADPEMQKDTVSYDEIAQWINGACDISLIAVDDNGLPLITTDEEGKSLGELSQINTIYRAKDKYLTEHTKTLSK